MNLIFLGTPDFSVASLESIYASGHKILAVVTQPDKPVGRSGKPALSPVKAKALELGLKVLQFEKIKSPEAVNQLKALNPDIMVTCAFGQILSREVLDIAPHGIINVHASLLPRYRGAAPIQWAILNGDKQTGVTIMKTEEGVDTGDIILSESTDIGEEETAGELFDRLALIGAGLITKALGLIECGKAVFLKQDDSISSHVKMLKKQDGMLNFVNSSEVIKNFVRGMSPWPCAFTFFKNKTFKVFKVAVLKGDFKGEAGTVVCSDRKNGLVVKTADGAVRLCEVQLEGGKRMSDCDFLLGREVPVGYSFANSVSELQ